MNFEKQTQPEEIHIDPEKRRAYLERFAESHPREKNILEKGGIWGERTIVRGGRRVKKSKEDAVPWMITDDDWKVAGEHTLMVGVVADILGERLALPEEERQKITSAAILHDWMKKWEVLLMRGWGVRRGYKESGEKDEEALRRLGVPEDVVRLTSANTPEEASEEYLKNRPIGEKIIHLADHVVGGSEISDFRARILEAGKRGYNREFMDLFREKFEGKPLDEVQLKATEMEQKEFEELLGIEEGSLVRMLKESFRERIEE